MTVPPAPWAPTHRLPPAGVLTWTRPAAGPPDAPPLEGGLEVQLLQAQGEWAEVCAADGSRAWVDGRALLPFEAMPVAGPPAESGPYLPPPEPLPGGAPVRSASWPRWVPVAIGAGVLAAVGIVVGVVLGTRDGSDAGTEPTGPAVTLQVPEGWTASADGLTVASSVEDLTAAVPLGPRVVATVNGPEGDVAAAFAAAFDETTYTMEGDPEEITVDGRRAVAVTLRWTWERVGDDYQLHPVDYLVRFVTVDSPTGESVLLEFSAPADQWDVVAPTLEQIPDLG